MKLTDPRVKSLVLFTVGALLIVSSILVYTHPWQRGDSIDWNLTLAGPGGQQKILTYKEIKAMPAYSGEGGFFTTTGVVNGPYDAKGVPVIDLCNLVGGLTSSEAIMASATDGYSSIFDYDQVTGGFITYDPKTMQEVPHGEIKLVLMYEQGGKPLVQDNGKPLRLAIIGKDALLTEGNMWIKWINRIEVMAVSQLQ